VKSRAPQLGAVQAIAPATLGALQANPKDPAAGASAVGDIMKGLGLPQAQAVALLESLTAPEVQRDLITVLPFARTLQSASKAIPARDLAYLSAHGAEVQKAQQDNPKQWQRWWWVCLAGQLLFLPFVFVMSGRWSPRKAREDELEHERRVQEELATMGARA